MSSPVPNPPVSRAPDEPRWTELVSAPADAPPLAPGVMACVGFGLGPDVSEDPRYVHVGLPLLAPGNRFELWKSARTVDWDREDGLGFSRDGELLFGQFYVLECELEDVAAATFRAYARIAAFLKRQGYTGLLRYWNFLHAINEGEADRERYKQFCVGRFQAMADAAGFERQLPASTAIGMSELGLLVYFLAAKTPGCQVENPRQMSAFHYPRRYGPRSPSFSRATFKRWNGNAQLLVSGTASLAGHATQHVGDPVAQLDETLTNIRALLQHAAETQLGRRDAACWVPESLKLYMRAGTDLAVIRQRVERVLGRDAPVVYLQGDICRSDMQLEMEGVFTSASG